jgi:hypothetical protein
MRNNSIIDILQLSHLAIILQIISNYYFIGHISDVVHMFICNVRHNVNTSDISCNSD